MPVFSGESWPPVVTISGPAAHPSLSSCPPSSMGSRNCSCPTFQAERFGFLWPCHEKLDTEPELAWWAPLGQQGQGEMPWMLFVLFKLRLRWVLIKTCTKSHQKYVVGVLHLFFCSGWVFSYHGLMSWPWIFTLLLPELGLWQPGCGISPEDPEFRFSLPSLLSISLAIPVQCSYTGSGWWPRLGSFPRKVGMGLEPCPAFHQSILLPPWELSQLLAGCAGWNFKLDLHGLLFPSSFYCKKCEEMRAEILEEKFDGHRRGREPKNLFWVHLCACACIYFCLGIDILQSTLSW